MPTPREALIEERRTHGGVLAIALRNGRLNTLTLGLRGALIDALDRAEADDDVTAVVIYGAGGIFSAGADLNEFDSGAGLAEPSLHGTISDFLDAMRTPVVALLEGVALGGGLELALACHYRLATAQATLGLPEISFGFLPGAGGTQRLPRAVGLERGLSMMLAGARVRGEDIGEGSLLAGIVGAEPLAEALAFAEAIAGAPAPRLRDVALDGPNAESFLAFAARAARGSAPREGVVAAVRAGLNDIDLGLAEEQRLFRELASSDGAAARRHLFLAERAARRVPLADAPPLRPESIGIVGGGTMGRGIALAHAQAGMEVTLVEAGEPQLAATIAALAQEADRAARSRKSGASSAADILGRITTTTELESLADADLVIEAVPERMAIKLDVFRRLDAVARPGAVLATNTSSLDIDEIAASTSRPEDVIGLHFFSPANVMRLLEVVRGARTSDRVLGAMLAHADRIGKVPVVSAVGPGFIGNRILEASNREVGLLLLEGATPRQIDDALRGWGMRMGPLQVLDLVGNDVPMDSRRAGGGADALQWRAASALVERGWLGVKTGRGWYRYEGGSPTPDPAVEQLLHDLAAQEGVARREIAPREIVERTILAMINEGAAVLEEGIASRASDIDVVFANGYGFPVDRGGPMHFADSMGLRNVVRILERFARRPDGERWRPRAVLTECAAGDEPLSSWEKTA